MANKLPACAGRIAREHKAVWRAYEAFGKACTEAGPLDRRTARLLKIALAAGAGTEGAVHSHVRRALDEGIRPDEIRHIALLAMPTLGFPQGVAALTWFEDILKKRR
jgi:alkylhydroperoxidase/carboxymuconolactone decarboxylase family protein YurZ